MKQNTATRWSTLLFCALMLALGACNSVEKGVVDLTKLGLADEARVSADKFTTALPAPGTEIFLVVTDLGTCLECKKAAIWVSNVWQDKSRPAALVYLETMRSEFDIPSTKQFIKEKKLRGLHYVCDEKCVEKLTKMLGEKPTAPMHYFIGNKGLVHWKGGFLNAYAPVLKAIRGGLHDVPLSVKAE